MRLLIVVPDQDRASGNWVTALRLADGLAMRGHSISLCDTAAASNGLQNAVAAFRPELVLLLHAWRSGRPWLDVTCAAPFAVLLTGTDVNEGLRDPDQSRVIEAVLARAAVILTQNPGTVAELHRGRPDLAGKTRYLPPGIVLGSARYPLAGRFPGGAGEIRFLCPAGIRPVKGVLELLALCDPLTRDGKPFRLLCCGPILDSGYGIDFLAAAAVRPWVTWLGTVPPDAMPDLMRQVDVIVNNSGSEGLSNALVEATVLGRPILARNIPGNAAVVRHGENGLLFDDAASFLAAAGRLIDNPSLRSALSQPDPSRYAADREAGTLEIICREVLEHPPKHSAPRTC